MHGRRPIKVSYRRQSREVNSKVMKREELFTIKKMREDRLLGKSLKR